MNRPVVIFLWVLISCERKCHFGLGEKGSEGAYSWGCEKMFVWEIGENLLAFQETQYAKWMACCRLAAKGRSLADSSYESEKQTILDFLQMQRPADGPAINPNSLDIQMEDYVAPRFMKKLRGKVSE
jgi:hypothetical protein